MAFLPLSKYFVVLITFFIVLFIFDSLKVL